jgi:zinc/manganese transport system permease protein
MAALVLWAPGIFTSRPVLVAWEVGGMVALVSGVVGVLTILRGQSFLGHALSDVGATGAAGATLMGLPALLGFLAGGVVAGIAVDLGGERVRERDLATGVVLSAMLGLGALFLYLLTETGNAAGAVETILFGSLFAVPPDLVPAVGLTSAVALALVALLWRPVWFATLTPESARARGVPVRAVGLLFTLAVVAAVEESALAVGALLSTALLIGPAAAAMTWARRPVSAVLGAAAIGVAATLIGVVLAYDSYFWPPVGRGWPVSFLITALVFLVYAASQWRRRRVHPGGGL